MKHGRIKCLLGGVIVAGFSLGAFAEMKDNPYQVIIARNPFGLREIPIVEPPKPPEPPPVPPPDIKLTGIHTLLGPPKVFLEITDSQTKKVERPPAMLEGETFHDVTVLSIAPEQGIVKIKVGEKDMTLDFDHNGVKPAGAVATAAPVPMGAVPINPAAVNPFPSAATTGGRTAILGGNNGTTAGAIPGVYNNNPAGGGIVPPRDVRSAGGLGISAGAGQPYNPNPVQPTAVQPVMSREEAEIAIEARRRLYEAQGNSRATILPPTSLRPVPAPAPGSITR